MSHAHYLCRLALLLAVLGALPTGGHGQKRPPKTPKKPKAPPYKIDREAGLALAEAIVGPWELRVERGGKDALGGRLVLSEDGTYRRYGQVHTRRGEKYGWYETFVAEGRWKAVSGEGVYLREKNDPDKATNGGGHYTVKLEGKELRLNGGRKGDTVMGRYLRPAAWKPPAAVDKGEAEKKALAALKKLGVSLSPEKPGQPIAEVMLFAASVKPEVVKELPGLPGLKSVKLWGGSLTDAALKDVRRVRGLETLWLNNVKGVTGAGLEALHGSNLRELFLEGVPLTETQADGLRRIPLRRIGLLRCKINGAALKRVAMMGGRVEGLFLEGNDLRDADLAIVGKLTALKELGLNSTTITGTGVAHLKGLKQLEFLRLDDNPLKESCLATVATFPKLRVLYLGNTSGVTDEGLKVIARIKTLRELTLATGTFSKITDAGVLQLKALPKLERLHLGINSKISGRARDELRKALPKLQITPR